MISDFNMKGNFLSQLAYVFLLPAFFLGSTLLYNQFDIIGYFSFGNFTYGFHFVMLSCIILVCALMSRTLLYFILKVNNLKWWQYGTWCFGELLLMSLFAGLYAYLFKDNSGDYLEVLEQCIKFIFLTLCYPYVFLILIRMVRIRDEELAQKTTQADNSLVRFHDEHKRLKLSIAQTAILYVKSEYNYVKIFYLDGGKVREYMLRASMKSLEDMGCRCLCRCQRSYFVNPEHVTVLRKDPEGFIYAEMNIPDLPAVPVSKQYYEALASRI